MADALEAAAAETLRALAARPATLGVAESLTGGMLAASLTAVPGASAVFRGGVVAYATEVKTALLAVPEATVRTEGVVSAAAAEAMARGARERLGATYALSTTGVAGPELQEGHRAGTVFVAVASPTGVDSDEVHLSGDRRAVREGACLAALSLLRRTLEQSVGPGDA